MIDWLKGSPVGICTDAGKEVTPASTLSLDDRLFVLTSGQSFRRRQRAGAVADGRSFLKVLVGDFDPAIPALNFDTITSRCRESRVIDEGEMKMRYAAGTAVADPANDLSGDYAVAGFERHRALPEMSVEAHHASAVIDGNKIGRTHGAQLSDGRVGILPHRF